MKVVWRWGPITEILRTLLRLSFTNFYIINVFYVLTNATVILLLYYSLWSSYQAPITRSSARNYSNPFSIYDAPRRIIIKMIKSRTTNKPAAETAPLNTNRLCHMSSVWLYRSTQKKESCLITSTIPEAANDSHIDTYIEEILLKQFESR